MAQNNRNQGLPAKRHGVMQDDAVQGQFAERDRAAVAQQQATDKLTHTEKQPEDTEAVEELDADALELEPDDAGDADADESPASKR